MNVSTQAQFSPQQVVCLEQGSHRLYASVIQLIEERQTYWLRPLCLIKKGETQTQVILPKTTGIKPRSSRTAFSSSVVVLLS